MPDLVRIRRERADHDFELILVSADDPDIARSKIQQTLKELGVDFPSYINTSNDEAFISSLNSEWSGAIPTSFVFNKSGSLVDMLIGKRSYADFTEILRKAVES
jgi:hypothetical protein